MECRKALADFKALINCQNCCRKADLYFIECVHFYCTTCCEEKCSVCGSCGKTELVCDNPWVKEVCEKITELELPDYVIESLRLVMIPDVPDTETKSSRRISTRTLLKSSQNEHENDSKATQIEIVETPTKTRRTRQIDTCLNKEPRSIAKNEEVSRRSVRFSLKDSNVSSPLNTRRRGQKVVGTPITSPTKVASESTIIDNIVNLPKKTLSRIRKTDATSLDSPVKSPKKKAKTESTMIDNNVALPKKTLRRGKQRTSDTPDTPIMSPTKNVSSESSTIDNNVALPKKTLRRSKQRISDTPDTPIMSPAKNVSSESSMIENNVTLPKKTLRRSKQPASNTTNDSVKSPKKRATSEVAMIESNLTSPKKTRRKAKPEASTPNSSVDSSKVSPKKKVKSDVANDMTSPLRTPAKVMKASELRHQTPKTMDKKNCKGETVLHRACKQKDIDAVKQLLESGADPNSQDYASWTPLHEAVHVGILPILELLLKSGALVDVAGLENKTALHVATGLGNAAVIKLLLEHGADPNAIDLFGNTPRSLAEELNNPELIQLLAEDQAMCPQPPQLPKMVLYQFGLHRAEVQEWLQFLAKFQIEEEKRDFYLATYVVISKDFIAEEFNEQLLKVMVKGTVILSFNWVSSSNQAEQLLDWSDFEFRPTWLPGLLQARANALYKRPGLFSGCYVLLGRPMKESYMYGGINIDLLNLRDLVRRAGGYLMNRMPDPDSPGLAQCVPYHGKGDMKNCNYIVIYLPGAWDVPIKYNMTNFKCLPFEWLIDAIVNFKLE